MRLTVFLAIAALALSSCALGPKPCTTEWVDWKTGRFLEAFAREHREDIESLRDTSARLSRTDDRSVENMARTALAGIKVLAIAADFLSGAAPEIRLALSQCGTAPKTSQLFASLLRREGFDERAIKAVEDFGAFIGKDG